MRLSPLPTSCQAVVCSAPGDFALGTVSIPEIGDDDVLIRSLVSGVSTGTDKWVMNGQFEWGGFAFPLVPGYQRVGIVEGVGRNVEAFQVDDVVFATSSKSFPDATAGWGAHSQWAVSEQEEVFAAQGLSRTSAALAVSLQVGVNAASRLSRPREQRVLVVGDGIIGVSAALAAMDRGSSVLLAGHHDERLKLVSASHPDIAIFNTHESWTLLLDEWAPTAVIDTVQSSDVVSEYTLALPCTWNAAVCSTPRSGIGEIVFAGHSPDGISSWADMALLQKQEVSVHFVSGWTRQRIQFTLELLRDGRLSLDPFIVSVQASSDELDRLLTQIAASSLPAIAACIDWVDS